MAFIQSIIIGVLITLSTVTAFPLLPSNGSSLLASNDTGIDITNITSVGLSVMSPPSTIDLITFINSGFTASLQNERFTLNEIYQVKIIFTGRGQIKDGTILACDYGGRIGQAEKKVDDRSWHVGYVTQGILPPGRVRLQWPSVISWPTKIEDAFRLATAWAHDSDLKVEPAVAIIRTVPNVYSVIDQSFYVFTSSTGFPIVVGAVDGIPRDGRVTQIIS